MRERKSCIPSGVRSPAASASRQPFLRPKGASSPRRYASKRRRGSTRPKRGASRPASSSRPFAHPSASFTSVMPGTSCRAERPNRGCSTSIEGPGGVGEPPLPRSPDPAVPFEANAARRHRIPRQRHRVTNGTEYEAALRQRGSLTVWFTEEAIRAWRTEPRTTPGGQPWYSPLAILTALTLRALFRLGLRQTEGLIASIPRLLGLELRVPDHTTLGRRARTLEVPRPRPGPGPLHLLVDSTGLRLSGPGEWLIEKHGTKERRAWRKLHLDVDAETGRIEAVELTTKDADDASRVGPLLDQVGGPIASLTGDGAYDQEWVYGAVAARHAEAAVVVPPRKDAMPSEAAATAPTRRGRHLRLT